MLEYLNNWFDSLHDPVEQQGVDKYLLEAEFKLNHADQHMRDVQVLSVVELALEVDVDRVQKHKSFLALQQISDQRVSRIQVHLQLLERAFEVAVRVLGIKVVFRQRLFIRQLEAALKHEDGPGLEGFFSDALDRASGHRVDQHIRL